MIREKRVQAPLQKNSAITVKLSNLDIPTI